MGTLNYYEWLVELEITFGHPGVVGPKIIVSVTHDAARVNETALGGGQAGSAALLRAFHADTAHVGVHSLQASSRCKEEHIARLLAGHTEPFLHC